jgi:hypothetical protein
MSYFSSANVQRMRDGSQREAIATNLANTQLPPLQGISKCLWTSLQSLGNFLDRVFREQLSRLIEFFFLPSTVIDLSLDSMLDNETPAFFLRAARLTLKPVHELDEFGSRHHPGLFR